MAEKGIASTGVSRRGMLMGMGALAAAGVAAGVGAGCSASAQASSGNAADATTADGMMHAVVPFRGEQQAGIYDVQKQMYVAVFDMITDEREELVKLLKSWTKGAENMCLGYPVNEPEASKLATPKDTGEAYDLGAASLTITFGFGKSMFVTEDGRDRFGLAALNPERLVYKMRKFPGDALVEEECGGDIYVKCAADDPQVAFHAMHNIIRMAYGKASIKWTKQGFINVTELDNGAIAPRDPFGFRDGTSNPEPGASDEDDRLLDKCVWIHAEDPQGEYFENGTYLQWRTFVGKLESWDNQTLEEQERVIGRTKLEGIPLSGGTSEADDPDLSATDEDGNFLIDPRSHVATLRAIRNETDHIMYRFGWNFVDGIDRLGQIQMGMHTGGYARDPEKDFYVFLDAFRDCDLTDYFVYTNSAAFLILPGIKEGDQYVGQSLFEATEA